MRVGMLYHFVYQSEHGRWQRILQWREADALEQRERVLQSRR